MTQDTLKAAFTLLVSAAQQARLTAQEHVAVQQAAQQVEAALFPPPADVPPAEPAA